MRGTLEERFWPKVRKTETCWLWLASTDKDGYGQIGSGITVRNPTHTMLKAHRVSWELVNGVIPEGLSCLHKCNNPICVNPGHLYLGTHLDNTLDVVACGSQRGENNPQAKLSDTQCVDIRAKRATGKLLRELAEEFGVRESTVSRICNNKRRT
jgi:hypothetical protein